MGLLSDWQIEQRLALPPGDLSRLVIEPFACATKVPGQPSHGLSSMGYDIRLGGRFLVFRKSMLPEGVAAQPHTFSRSAKYTIPTEADACLIPPNGFVLAESLEWLEIPRDCLAQVIGKSTWARLGLCLNCTPLENQWRGKITLELANLSPLPILVRAGQGIGQVIFHVADLPCRTSYAEKAGAQYQEQTGLTLPRTQ